MPALFLAALFLETFSPQVCRLGPLNFEFCGLRSAPAHCTLTHNIFLPQVDLKAAIIRDPLSLDPSANVQEAVCRMISLRDCAGVATPDWRRVVRSSCVLVVEATNLVGILTERDVVRLSAQGADLETLTLEDAMTQPVLTLEEATFTNLFAAVKLMQHHQIRHLPMVDEAGQLSGMLTHESLRRLSRPTDLLRLRLVEEVMTQKVVCAFPDTCLEDIVDLLSRHRVSSVMIVTREQNFENKTIQVPQGIITEQNIVQFQAQGVNLSSEIAAAVMGQPVFSVYPDDSLWYVQQQMEQHGTRQLAVTGSERELLGIVTQTSLLRALNPLELYKLAEVLEQKVMRLEAEKVELLESRTVELEQQVKERTAALQTKVEQERLLTAVASQIRSFFDLQEILNTAVSKLQATLECDRVIIWRVQPTDRMEAVAEATSGTVKSFLGRRTQNAYLLLSCVSKAQKPRIKIIADIHAETELSCSPEVLEQQQIRATVQVPILCDDELWGVLETVESLSPRRWQLEEITLLKRLSTQLAIAIQQAATYEQIQTELTERRNTEMRLRESEQRYATLAAVAPVGIFRTDARGHCVYVNEQWCLMTGLESSQAMGLGWLSGIHRDDYETVSCEWYRTVKEHCSFQLEYRFAHDDGSTVWVFGQAIPHYDDRQQLRGYVGTITDISDLKQAQKLIIHNALHDPLTDLPNRTLLTERIDLAISRTRHLPTYQYAILFLDLDRFKIINDSLGHLAGDQLLKTIARRLSSYLRTIDMVARLGGDEFVILLEEVTSAEEVIEVAEKILADCQKPLNLNGYEMFTTLSIGIVLGNRRYHQASELIRDADIALYRAKAKGRNSYQIFDAAMHTQALQRLNLETGLRRALSQDEFVVVYQPIVDLVTHRIVGFEALIRWRPATNKIISPDKFVPVAEEIGLIVPIDSWVMQTVCQQLARWRTQFPHCCHLKMGLNLSVKDLRQAGLVEEIDRVLATTGLAGSSICLEVTESILIDDISQTVDVLSQLKARNIQIGIDDFGTGYSSLTYLHQLPADILKIDRSFVGQMQTGSRNYQLVSTIIALGKQLGLTVVAEGIETRQQLQWLQDLGCPLGQGFLFSTAVEPAEIENRFLRSGLLQLPLAR